MYAEMENDESPVHIACTQEGCDNVDVVWDWNSPRAKQQPKRPQKRLISQSPKVPVKRHPSNNQIQNFEKLRDELQALREAIALPDHEESLMLSPVEEAEYKHVNDQNADNVRPLTQEVCLEGIDADLFNDSADEDLILCTQKLEADLKAIEKKTSGCSSNLINNPNRGTKVTHIDIDKDIRNIGFSSAYLQPTKNFNDKKDPLVNISMKINAEHLDSNKVIHDKISYNQSLKSSAHLGFPRTRSENQFKNCRQIGKVEFHRTHSFESSVEYKKEVIPQHKLDEIERKRKEALAKLELKRKQEHSDSLSRCSPEEIEKKRLQALAKLEAKRQQEIIERKRREALKRLELSRKKNAMIVRSSLSTRL
ncbi:eukaryotic translation initiation factor 3 subunit A-like [Anoplophora glabripennis]|uniref:eukaryotic translation initiation factor 3 subunit A-like n=1 Tax=Anoplophora glabripennis TaxID=217634 RepID=UPI000873D144|nr:eukaryotic translation initiation factor 3 subunit A-like [Anoplophora glabripennis]